MRLRGSLDLGCDLTGGSIEGSNRPEASPAIAAAEPQRRAVQLLDSNRSLVVYLLGMAWLAVRPAKISLSQYVVDALTDSTAGVYKCPSSDRLMHVINRVPGCP